MLQITDEQVALLRAFLEGPSESGNVAASVATGPEPGAFGVLLDAAFSRAVRRRFGPVYTAADIVAFVASARISVMEGVEFSAAAAETLTRRALGESVTSDSNPAILVILLLQIVLDEGLSGDVLSEFLAAARKDADDRLALPHARLIGDV